MLKSVGLQLMVQFILYSLSGIFYFYLAASTLYLFVIAIAGKVIKAAINEVHPVKKTIALLIPAYKEDVIIIGTARKALDHNYPEDFFSVIIIADQLQHETVNILRSMGVQVLEVNFEVSMKAKSLHAALQLLQTSQHEIAVILDADNVMKDNCLEKINAAFHNGCKAVQCHRIAKNVNHPLAILEAISEGINIHLFRRGPAALGLSAAPLGSGMAFYSGLLKEIYSHDLILHDPAEDRETDTQLLKRNIRMYYLDDAYVYDEKVASLHVFEKQRTRWLEAQVHHLRRFFQKDMKDVPKTAHYYNRIIQHLLLPRLFYLVICGLTTLLLIAEPVLDIRLLYPHSEWWLAWIVWYCVVLIISIPAEFFNFKALKAAFYLPALMISMLKALAKMKSNRKEFLHTSKSYTPK